MTKLMQTVDSGIKPLTLDCEDVRTFGGRTVLLRTYLTVNSLELGVLTYEQYRYTARRTKLCDALVRRHLEKLCREIPSYKENRPELKLFSLPVYVRTVKDGELLKILAETLSKESAVSPSELCVELSADLLFEELDGIIEELHKLRELGVVIILSEVGDEYCPVFRLSEIPFDYAVADVFATSSLTGKSEEKIAGSLVGFIHTLGAKVIATGIDTEEKYIAAKAMGFDGYTGIAFTADGGEEI